MEIWIIGSREVPKAYKRIFNRCGLDYRIRERGQQHRRKISEEFVGLCDIGGTQSSTAKKATPLSTRNSCDLRRPLAGRRKILIRGIEVGHIFKLGTKYSLPVKQYCRL